MAIGNAADIKSSGGEKLATIDRGPLSEPRGLVREMMTKGNMMGFGYHTREVSHNMSHQVYLASMSFTSSNLPPSKKCTNKRVFS